RITEDKSSLLATLDYLEKQRRAEQDTKRSANDEINERWQTITEKTQHLRDLNQHNGWLLEGQIIRNQQALEVLKPYKEPGLYGADGQTATA
ncbi:flagellar export chaperone FlgN, partial [Klebsiella pneumoniae]|nr:flagellar export chaperone FlgN [Klebsiella pneumoniae]